jgi:hypothetical protein
LSRELRGRPLFGNFRAAAEMKSLPLWNGTIHSVDRELDEQLDRHALRGDMDE